MYTILLCVTCDQLIYNTWLFTFIHSLVIVSVRVYLLLCLFIFKVVKPFRSLILLSLIHIDTDYKPLLVCYLIGFH